MLKIKLFAVMLVLGLTAVVLSSSDHFQTAAQDDPVLTELANYRDWTKITERPIEATANVAPMG